MNANAGIDPVMSHSCVGDSWLLHKPQARRRLPKESFLQKVPLCAVSSQDSIGSDVGIRCLCAPKSSQFSNILIEDR